MSNETVKTGYPSIDKPWNKYFDAIDEVAGTKGPAIPNCSMFDYLKECNADNLDYDALDYFGVHITYGQLFERVENLAKALLANGIKAGDVVTIITLNSVEAYELEYACNRIGAIFDFISVVADENDFVHYFESSEAKMVFVLDLFATKALNAAHQVEAVQKVVILDLADEMPTMIKLGYKLKNRGQDKSFLSDPMVMKMSDFRVMGQDLTIDYKKDPSTAAAYAHTGGTTGFPKTVVLSDMAYNSVASCYVKYLPRSRGGYALNCTVPFVVYSNSIGMHMPMCTANCCMIIVPKFEAKDWGKYFKKYPNMRFIICVPSQLAPWIEDPKLKNIDLSPLEALGVGGEGFTDDFEEQLTKCLIDRGCKAGNVVMGYGMSEVGAAAATNYPNGILDLLGVSNDIVVYKKGSVGFPHKVNEFVIWDNDNNCECKYNEVGEVAIYSKAEMLEYKDDPEATAELHKTHPDGKSYIHTGDLGYFDEDGFLFITGRMKRIFMTWFYDDQGHLQPNKCFPSLAENALSKHPSVSQVCCVEMRNDELHRLKAFIAPTADNTLSHEELEAELRALAAEKVVAYQNPSFYEFRESLPLTAVGKIDFQALEDEEAEKTASEENAEKED